MTKLNFTFSQGLFQRYQDFWIRYYFKFVLPKIANTTLDGVRLDLTQLPLKIRNRILNVGYEDEEKQMCRDFLTTDDSVLEIGGAIGFIGLFCQKQLGIKKYITVEANPATAELLKKNYAANNVTPVLWNLALGKENGTVQLDVGGDFWENSLIAGGTGSKARMIEVPSATLKALFEKAGRPINVLIIDIEGAEQFINFEEIPAQVNKIIIELHPDVIGQEATYNIISTLISKGFRVAREKNETFAFLKK